MTNISITMLPKKRPSSRCLPPAADHASTAEKFIVLQLQINMATTQQTLANQSPRPVLRYDTRIQLHLHVIVEPNPRVSLMLESDVRSWSQPCRLAGRNCILVTLSRETGGKPHLGWYPVVISPLMHTVHPSGRCLEALTGRELRIYIIALCGDAVCIAEAVACLQCVRCRVTNPCLCRIAQSHRHMVRRWREVMTSVACTEYYRSMFSDR